MAVRVAVRPNRDNGRQNVIDNAESLSYHVAVDDNDPERPIFTRGDVMRLTGASRGQLSHWPTLGVITGLVRESSGAGDPRLYSFRNLIEFRVGVVLAWWRIPAPVILEVLGSPLTEALDLHRPILTVTNLGGGFSFTTEEEMSALHDVGVQAFIVINLKSIADFIVARHQAFVDRKATRRRPTRLPR